MAKQKSMAEETGFGVATMPDSAQGLRYVGDGEYIFNVPARDLSAEEAATYAPMAAISSDFLLGTTSAPRGKRTSSLPASPTHVQPPGA